MDAKRSGVLGPDEHVLILGATSGIGRAFVRALGALGCRLILSARNAVELERVAGDCRVRFEVPVEAIVFDALDFDQHREFTRAVLARAEGRLDGVVSCLGAMPDEALARSDIRVARRMIDTNFTSAVSLLEGVASAFEEQGHGWICAVSSVAGDRGRASNYLYGATKGALDVYLQGLRMRLARSGGRVSNIKPGFVDTGMTYGRPGLFWLAPPERIARDALRAVRRDRATLYTPWFWWGIMRILRALPDRIFKRLDL